MADLVPHDQFDRLPERYRLRAREIARRVGEIDALSKPCDTADIGPVMLRMFRQFRDQPGVNDAEMAEAFREACRDLPTWALSEAANDFLAGRVDSHTGQFMPTCAEFAKRARSILVPFLSERSSLRVEASKLVERAADDYRRHQIEIERQSPAVRRRVADLVDAFGAGSPKPQSLPHAGLSEETQARLNALKKSRQFVSKIGHEQQKREG